MLPLTPTKHRPGWWYTKFRLDARTSHSRSKSMCRAFHVKNTLVMGFQDGQFNINVINKLNDTTMVRTTSIVSFHLHSLLHKLISDVAQHWHGLFQRGTEWAD